MSEEKRLTSCREGWTKPSPQMRDCPSGLPMIRVGTPSAVSYSCILGDATRMAPSFRCWATPLVVLTCYRNFVCLVENILARLDLFPFILAKLWVVHPRCSCLFLHFSLLVLLPKVSTFFRLRQLLSLKLTYSRYPSRYSS